MKIFGFFESRFTMCSKAGKRLDIVISREGTMRERFFMVPIPGFYKKWRLA